MASAEILTIGTEILLGEIVDTNTRYLSRKLREQGIDLYRQTTVGDNIHRIAQAIQHSLPVTDIIITTGGLGPTIDDPTRQAIADAVGVKIEFRAELWDQIQERYQRYGRTPTENNKRQAFVPQGAIAVENPVGTAPAFIVETQECAIIALPGVPREMEHLMENEIIPYLHRRLDLRSVIKTRLIHTAGAGESQIDDLIGDLEGFSNPTVGLAAHSGQVDVRITAKGRTDEEADLLIRSVEQELRKRLEEWIYGADEETLEQTALNNLQSIGWKLVVIEIGLKGELIHRLAAAEGPFIGGEALTTQVSEDELFDTLEAYRNERSVEAALGVTIHPGTDRQKVYLALVTPEEKAVYPIYYGGPPGYTIRWAVNQCLDLLRKL
jgi:competence/damage-inducible protein CinA-like protein